MSSSIINLNKQRLKDVGGFIFPYTYKPLVYLGGAIIYHVFRIKTIRLIDLGFHLIVYSLINQYDLNAKIR